MSERAKDLRTEGVANVGIVGARGYSGLELSRLLLKHPLARLVACYGNSDFRLADYLIDSRAAAVTVKSMESLLTDVQRGESLLIFLATPAEVSMDLAPKIIGAGASVIDLSGAFRLKADPIRATYLEWYKMDHTAAALVETAHFGLMSWETLPLRKGQGPSKEAPILIANPGCFATAILLALLPLIRSKIIDPDSVVIDAKSGTTGAGKKAEERLLFSEVEGQCLPYRVGRHQHLPEIYQTVFRHTGVRLEAHMTTHLLNVRRGIIAGIYAQLSDEFLSQQAGGDEARASAVVAALKTHYQRDALVDVQMLTAQNEAQLLNLRKIVGTARTQIALKVVGKKLYVFSLIDNLMKGAASQAIENFNQWLGVETHTGLKDQEAII